MGSWGEGGRACDLEHISFKGLPTADAQEIVTKQTRERAKVKEDQFFLSLKSLHSRFLALKCLTEVTSGIFVKKNCPLNHEWLLEGTAHEGEPLASYWEEGIMWR